MLASLRKRNPLALVLAVALAVGTATAQDASGQVHQGGRSQQAVGRQCGKVLESVQELTEAARWADASAALEGAQASCTTSYEKSQLYNFLGYVYYSLKRYGEAINAYKKMLAEPDVDGRQAINTRYTVAQLYLAQEDYVRAARELEAWMQVSPIVGSDAKVLLGRAYYQLGRQKEALALVEEAINEHESKGNLPKEGWWSLQRVIYYERKDYQRVVAVLKKLIRHYPSFSYWRQLGGMYAELDQDINQLVATELAYLAGDLNQEKQLIGLAYLYLGVEAPFLAARLIEKGMKEGKIARNPDNLEVLGMAWQQAQDAQKALPILEEAARGAGKGAIYARLSSVYLNLEHNGKAVLAARNAIRLGGISRVDITYMNLGNALINLHCYPEAIQAFNAAAQDERSATHARQWMEYAKREGERRDQLIKAGANIGQCRRG